MVALMKYTSYGKTVGISVAALLIRAHGDPERALELAAEVDTSQFADPGMAEIAKTLAEQSIREAAAAL